MAGAKPPLRALLVNDASLAGHHGSAIVTEQLVRLAAEAGIEVVHGWTWDAVSAALAAPRIPFDLVIVNGEGSLHSDSRSARRIAEIARDLAARGAPPAYLVNATVEGNSAETDRDLGRFRLRFVRDSASRAYLLRAGVASEVVHDLTLTASQLPRADGAGALFVTDASDQDTSRRLMALARKWPYAAAITLRAPPPWPARGSPARNIGFALKRPLARMVPSSPSSPWALRYGAALTRDAFLGGLAREARGLVSGRYHAVTLAIRMGLPFLAIAGNTGKTGALLADAGLDRRGVDLAELEARDGPPEIAPFSDEERARLGAFLLGAERGAAAMLGRIAQDAREGAPPA